MFYNQTGCCAKEDESVLEPGPSERRFLFIYLYSFSHIDTKMGNLNFTDSLKLNKWSRSKFFEVLSNFSLCSSTKKLLDCTLEGDALDVIRGMKVLTVIFAIYTHTYALPHPLHLYRFREYFQALFWIFFMNKEMRIIYGFYAFDNYFASLIAYLRVPGYIWFSKFWKKKYIGGRAQSAKCFSNNLKICQ